MKIRRTPWWQYVVALLLGLIAGCLLAHVSESSGLSLLGAPWFVSVVLLLLGIVVLVMALQVHQYATTDPQKRARLKPLDPTKAVYTLMLSKALGLTGAALAGWYVGQILLVLDHIEADYYATAVTQCAVAAVICLADMVIGIVGAIALWQWSRFPIGDPVTWVVGFGAIWLLHFPIALLLGKSRAILRRWFWTALPSPRPSARSSAPSSSASLRKRPARWATR